MMLWSLLILFLLVAGWWIALLFLPSQRAAHRFTYGPLDAPDKFNGLIPRDDVRHAFAGDPTPWPEVTVVVPGRNEGHVLNQTLRSLCLQDYPNYRVVFIDDQSTDNSAEVAARLQAEFPHLTVLHNTQPPAPGWVGKVWAIHQARTQINPQTEYLLFCDSDLQFDPHCLRQMIRLARHRNTDLTSILPALECHSFGEFLGILAGMVAICIAYPVRVSNTPRTSKVLVAGGFMLFKRAAYDAFGGHEAVRGQVVEDIALGTLAKTSGLRVFTVHADRLLRAHMYEGVRDTFRGLAKNAYAGAHYNPFLGVFFFVLMLFAGCLVPVYPLIGLGLWIVQPSLMTAAICAASIAGAIAMIDFGARTARLVALRTVSGWLLPASFCFFLAVLVTSIFDHYRGGNRWSGRRIDPKDVQTIPQARRNSP